MSYYNRDSSATADYQQYIKIQSESIRTDIKHGAERTVDAIVRMQTGVQTAINTQTTEIVASNEALKRTYQDGSNQLNHTLDMSFSGISNQLGHMTSAFACDKFGCLFTKTCKDCGKPKDY